VGPLRAARQPRLDGCRHARSLWEQIRRTARSGARVIFRTAGLRSPLEQLLPAEALDGWRCHAEDAKRLFERDRSAIYGGFHLYSRA